MAEPFERFRDCDVCPEMVELPLGEFIMGAPLGEAHYGVVQQNGIWISTGDGVPFINSREQPLQNVSVTTAIAIGRNEVTYAEWMACVEDGGCGGYVPSTKYFTEMANGEIATLLLTGTYPVTRVSYLDIQLYLDWLNSKAGSHVYRLPTEAEWEYAARSGTQTPFAQGNSITQQQANFGSSDRFLSYTGDTPLPFVDPLPVVVEALDAANAWGLRHMSGNVFEVTGSCWFDRHRPWTQATDYLFLDEADDQCSRVARGGDFQSDWMRIRPAWRTPVDGDSRTNNVGFRVVATISIQPPG